MVLLTARMKSKNIEEMALKYPVVLACEYIEGSAIPTVSINNISGAQKATEYLVKLGHKRIGFISGPLDGVIGQDRLKGFYQTMARYNLTIESVLVQEGNFFYESGFNIMNQFLDLNHPPTAVFAANDEMAFGAINAISSKGLSVPHDISVVGFDDIKFSSIFKPALTTISQPAFEMGTMAMKLLIKLMNKEEIERHQYLMEDQLIIRDSCSTHIS